MDKFYEWLETKHKITADKRLAMLTQSYIGFMIEFISEHFNCKEIDINRNGEENMYVTTYDLLKREIEKKTK